ncbi:hypothetical protein AKJ16_DCAP19759 [Drosera capensis]
MVPQTTTKKPLISTQKTPNFSPPRCLHPLIIGHPCMNGFVEGKKSHPIVIPS